MAAAVVGRDNELAQVERFLEEARERYAVLVFEGEAGIGKTTVWREALRRGDERGFRVLACRPAQAEAKLGFAALADLLSSVDEDALSELPDPQRQAMEAALLRAAPSIDGSQSRAVAAGLRAVLSRLADESPLLVAIDDVQWLDRPSATAVSFALRRLDPAKPGGVVAALRIDQGAVMDPLGLAGLPAGASERIRLGPLTLSAIYHVINTELGLVFPRPTLQRIEDASGGNPLLAIELARALAESGVRPGPGDPLPVPTELIGLLSARVSKLPARSRDALLAAASLSEPTVGQVERALGPSAAAAVERALQAQLIELRGESIRFAHPLVEAAVASSVVPATRNTTSRAGTRRSKLCATNPNRRARLGRGT